jgi:hypothetical protein
MTKNLDELHSTNPKDFWKLLNKEKRKNQSDIGIDKLFNFLKDLNSDSEGNVYEGQLDMDEGTLEQINSHINLPKQKTKFLNVSENLKMKEQAVKMK